MVGGEEVSEIWEGQRVESFIGEDQEFVLDPSGEGKPGEVFEDRGDVVARFGVSEETGCCVLDQSESVDGDVADAGEE